MQQSYLSRWFYKKKTKNFGIRIMNLAWNLSILVWGNLGKWQYKCGNPGILFLSKCGNWPKNSWQPWLFCWLDDFLAGRTYIGLTLWLAGLTIWAWRFLAIVLAGLTILSAGLSIWPAVMTNLLAVMNMWLAGLTIGLAGLTVLTGSFNNSMSLKKPIWQVAAQAVGHICF